MTRILVLTNMYPPHHYGGYELSCQDVVARWRASGHEVTVLTSDMRLPDVPAAADDLEPGVRRELGFYFRDHDLYVPSLARRLSMERRNQRVLDDVLGATRPDVVSLWHMGAMSFSLITTLVERRLPLVYVVCDDWLSYGPNVDGWMRLFRPPRAIPGPVASLIRRVTGVPTHIPDLGPTGTFVFVSACTQARSERYAPWTFADATVVHSGIDLDDFPPPLEAPGERPWAWRLLYVGRLDPRKGIETAVRALAELPPDTTLDVVGRGDDAYRSDLERVAEAVGAGGRVRFGSSPRAELAERYRQADVLVFPVEWEEPFGLAPLEAMACGTPVVATGRGGSGEYLVDGVNCALFTAGSAQGLAAAVRRLADDDALRSAVVGGGLTTAAELDVDHLASRLEAIHVGVAEQRALPRA